jgi:hypothetical protein
MFFKCFKTNVKTTDKISTYTRAYNIRCPQKNYRDLHLVIFNSNEAANITYNCRPYIKLCEWLIFSMQIFM